MINEKLSNAKLNLNKQDNKIIALGTFIHAHTHAYPMVTGAESSWAMVRSQDEFTTEVNQGKTMAG